MKLFPESRFVSLCDMQYRLPNLGHWFS